MELTCTRVNVWQATPETIAGRVRVFSGQELSNFVTFDFLFSQILTSVRLGLARMEVHASMELTNSRAIAHQATQETNARRVIVAFFNNVLFYRLYFYSDVDECASFPCENGGMCIDEIDFFTCNCNAGFTGGQCETSELDLCHCDDELTLFLPIADIDECASSPCKNGGTCIDLNVEWTISSFSFDVGYTCQCMAGYTGVQCETSKKSCSVVLVRSFILC